VTEGEQRKNVPNVDGAVVIGSVSRPTSGCRSDRGRRIRDTAEPGAWTVVIRFGAVAVRVVVDKNSADAVQQTMSRPAAGAARVVRRSRCARRALGPSRRLLSMQTQHGPPGVHA
jgi:hypothetical protein